MKITSRKTHTFIELKVDEIETTVYKSNPKEVEDMIYNLLEIVNDLASYTDKSLKDYLTSSQTEISDEEIIKEGRKRSWTFAFFLHDYEKGWVDAIKWYREKLKSKQ